MRRCKIEKPIGDGWKLNSITVYSLHNCSVRFGEIQNIILTAAEPSYEFHLLNINPDFYPDFIVFEMYGKKKKLKELETTFKTDWRNVDGSFFTQRDTGGD